MLQPNTILNTIYRNIIQIVIASVTVKFPFNSFNNFFVTYIYNEESRLVT